jgi:hypothetical protein
VSTSTTRARTSRIIRSRWAVAGSRSSSWSRSLSRLSRCSVLALTTHVSAIEPVRARLRSSDWPRRVAVTDPSGDCLSSPCADLTSASLTLHADGLVLRVVAARQWLAQPSSLQPPRLRSQPQAALHRATHGFPGGCPCLRPQTAAALDQAHRRHQRSAPHDQLLDAATDATAPLARHPRGGPARSRSRVSRSGPRSPWNRSIHQVAPASTYGSTIERAARGSRAGVSPPASTSYGRSASIA